MLIVARPFADSVYGPEQHSHPVALSLCFRTRSLSLRSRTQLLFRCLFARGHFCSGLAHGRFFAAFLHTVAFAALPHAVAFLLSSCPLNPLHTHLFIQFYNPHGRPPSLTISSGNTSVRYSTILVTKSIQFRIIASCSTVSVFVSSIIS